MTWAAQRLRRLRLELGWSQAEMARRMGMETHRWVAIERSEVALDEESRLQLEKLSQHLKDYTKSLRFSASSDPYLKENRLNQISEFDLESVEE